MIHFTKKSKLSHGLVKQFFHGLTASFCKNACSFHFILLHSEITILEIVHSCRLMYLGKPLDKIKRKKFKADGSKYKIHSK